ncbi:DDE-type integrase/transposase/recombinase [Vibrio atlanticus]|uniref:DDE-type integrase/transposase/recombinase n=1 Tax=Vibrio atlanticus TaxID=693153 RepID=A0ABV4KPG4_9VIBR
MIAKLQEAAERYPAYGFSKLFKILRRWGHPWNHKRVYRVYCALKLNLRRKGKKRLPNRNPAPLAVPEYVNACWSMDFVSDALHCGRRFRTLNIVDDFNREALAIEVDLNLPAQRVIRTLERLIAWRGVPSKIRVDNGPEFIEPGQPTQKFIHRALQSHIQNRVTRMYVFSSLNQVREMTDKWMREYNEERPYDSLDDLTPWEYLVEYEREKMSNLECH